MIEPMPRVLQGLHRKLSRRACRALNVALEFHGVELVLRALAFDSAPAPTDVRVSLVLAMWRDGLTRGQIARLLGTSVHVVESMVYAPPPRASVGYRSARPVIGPAIERALAETKAANRARMRGAA